MRKLIVWIAAGGALLITLAVVVVFVSRMPMDPAVPAGVTPSELPGRQPSQTVPVARPSVALQAPRTATASIAGPAAVEPPTAEPVPRTWQQVFDAVATRYPATWVVQDLGDWGSTLMPDGIVYIAPRTPWYYLADVMVHEYMHVLQGRIYGGYRATVDALAPYDIPGVAGIEVIADCGALQMGATFTHYVKRCTATQNQAATAIREGRKP